MQNLNLILFSAINAGTAPQPGVVKLAIFAADWLVYVIPALLLLSWLFGTRPTRRQAIEAGLGACVALALAQVFSHVWFSPRPFMAGVGTQLIPHAPDGSFPSDHMTFVWSIAVGMLIGGSTRTTGFLMAVCAMLIAWGRIYVGVHWPFDMAGGMLVGTAGALAVHLYARPLTAMLERIGESVHALVAARMRVSRG
jgi:undecaprenyl-diphosphatase